MNFLIFLGVVIAVNIVDAKIPDKQNHRGTHGQPMASRRVGEMHGPSYTAGKVKGSERVKVQLKTVADFEPTYVLWRLESMTGPEKEIEYKNVAKVGSVKLSPGTYYIHADVTNYGVLKKIEIISDCTVTAEFVKNKTSIESDCDNENSDESHQDSPAGTDYQIAFPGQEVIVSIDLINSATREKIELFTLHAFDNKKQTVWNCLGSSEKPCKIEFITDEKEIGITITAAGYKSKEELILPSCDKPGTPCKMNTLRIYMESSREYELEKILLNMTWSADPCEMPRRLNYELDLNVVGIPKDWSGFIDDICHTYETTRVLRIPGIFGYGLTVKKCANANTIQVSDYGYQEKRCVDTYGWDLDRNGRFVRFPVIYDSRVFWQTRPTFLGVETIDLDLNRDTNEADSMVYLVLANSVESTFRPPDQSWTMNNYHFFTANPVVDLLTDGNKVLTNQLHQTWTAYMDKNESYWLVYCIYRSANGNMKIIKYPNSRITRGPLWKEKWDTDPKIKEDFENNLKDCLRG